MRSFAIKEAPSPLPTLYVTLLPSVVGPPESKFFLISSIVSLTNKLILLTVAVLLVLYTNIDTNPLLFGVGGGGRRTGCSQPEVL